MLEVNAQNDFEKMKQNVTTHYEIILQSNGKNKQKDEITFLSPCVIQKKKIMVKTFLIMKD